MWRIVSFPARVFTAAGVRVSRYRLDADFLAGDATLCLDLAAAMLAELGSNGHVRQKVSSTTR